MLPIQPELELLCPHVFLSEIKITTLWLDEPSGYTVICIVIVCWLVHGWFFLYVQLKTQSVKYHWSNDKIILFGLFLIACTERNLSLQIVK